MSGHKKKKLFYQFLTFIIPFIILSIVTTGLVLSLTNKKFFQQNIYQVYRNILKSSAVEIRQFMDNAQHNLESLALLMSSAKLDYWQKEIALTAFVHANQQFVSVELIPVNSEEAVSPVSGGRLSDDSVRQLFKQALSDQKVVSGIIKSENEIPVLCLALPVFQQGLVEEVLWAKMNLKSVWDVLKGIKVGKTGHVHIMDACGRIIVHTEIDRVVNEQCLEHHEVLKEIQSSKEPVEWRSNIDGKQYYNLGIYLPLLNWVVVLNQQKREIYAYLYKNALWASLIIIIICMVVVLWGWLMIRRFLVPIQTLHRQVQKIGRGNLDQKVSVTPENEIGDLGIAFNEMTESLKNHIEREVVTASELAHSKNLALLGTASSKMTHEVGNFINGIHMVLAALKNESLSQNGEKVLTIIEKESDQVREYIQKFLQFARKPALDLKKRSVGLIIQEHIEIVGSEAEKRGIQISFKWDSAIPDLNIDTDLIRQVFNNLIKNSMEAISGEGTITISGNIENENLVISIADTGQGIAPENMENIFEPFFSTKGSRGTGLGMSIVKSNIEVHGGSITCKSEPEKGTEFIICLPLFLSPALDH